VTIGMVLRIVLFFNLKYIKTIIYIFIY
jgi:hypothetical protein